MTERMDRREFSAAMALLLLGGATITVSGCGGGGGYGGAGNPAGSSGGGGSDDYGPGGNTDPGGGAVGQISANHGHRAVITRAELTSGNSLTLDIQGEATHNHTVVLSDAEVRQVRDGARLSKGTSTTDAHSHTVTFN